MRGTKKVLIGLSCGHRVPRPAERPPLGRGHWCEECGAHRLSGGKSTGERAFDGFLQLPIICDGLEVNFRGLMLPEYSLQLLAVLGVKPANYKEANPPFRTRRDVSRARQDLP